MHGVFHRNNQCFGAPLQPMYVTVYCTFAQMTSFLCLRVSAWLFSAKYWWRFILTMRKIYTTSIQPSFMPEGDPSLSTSFVVSREAVYKKLSSLNSTKAQGPDGVPAWLLKENADCLVDPTYNLNCSFPEGCLPPSWNRADHIPVPKAKTVKEANKNLRPISLTPILSKVAEHFVVEEFAQPARFWKNNST